MRLIRGNILQKAEGKTGLATNHMFIHMSYHMIIDMICYMNIHMYLHMENGNGNINEYGN